MKSLLQMAKCFFGNHGWELTATNIAYSWFKCRYCGKEIKLSMKVKK